MLCKICNNDILPGNLRCPNCGTLVEEEHEIQTSQVIPLQKEIVPQAKPMQSEIIQSQGLIDKAEAWLNVVGFCFPMVGILLYFIMKATTPIKAKSIGIWSFIGILAFVLVIIFVIAIFVAVISEFTNIPG